MLNVIILSIIVSPSVKPNSKLLGSVMSTPISSTYIWLSSPKAVLKMSEEISPSSVSCEPLESLFFVPLAEPLEEELSSEGDVRNEL